ncbi:hypothetical protein CYMTET_44726 [Cymbomonas tetramitiformis]|uniref:PiggyBac transposable element-derived protein domain-containing protein n=1 Tax=Cymbomonas tetramitiformis TaxID=36881 RepID=A0AAE0EZA2_9CHLO|nr:hypothetical protein CYMTET_44726 [Cymbomonas tetramitiformis]
MASSGTKGVLRARLEKAIEKAKKSTDASTVTSIRQPPNTTAPKAPAAPRSTSKKKAESTTLESPWVELSPAQAAAARWVRPSYTGPEVGCPSAKADRLLDPFVSEPLDYFNAFIPKVERHSKWKQHSNVYATTQGASTDKCPNFKPFSAAEIDINVGLLIRNGLSPVPDFRYNFTPPSSNFVFGDDRVIAALSGGYGRYKEFRAFFHLQDPRLAEPPDQPFWKLKPIFDVVRTNIEELWYLGKHVSLDEQDCCQGYDR